MTTTTAPSPALQFDAEAHAYRVSGRRIQSVTQILGARGLVDDSWFTPESRERGTAVHAAIRYWDEGDLDTDSVCAAVKPYLMAYIRFAAETQFETLANELSLYHPAMRYAGTLDKLGWLHGELTLVDFKSGAYCPVHDVQLVMYLDLVIANADSIGIRPEELKHVRPLVVELHADGDYKLKPMTRSLQAASALAHACLLLTHFAEGT